MKIELIINQESRELTFGCIRSIGRYHSICRSCCCSYIIWDEKRQLLVREPSIGNPSKADYFVFRYIIVKVGRRCM
jgi:hypothetical protein